MTIKDDWDDVTPVRLIDWDQSDDSITMCDIDEIRKAAPQKKLTQGEKFYLMFYKGLSFNIVAELSPDDENVQRMLRELYA